MAGPWNDGRWIAAPSIGALILPVLLAARPFQPKAPAPPAPPPPAPPPVSLPEPPPAPSLSIGRSFQGKLLRGRQLAERGHGYFTLYPDRLYGTDELVGGLLSVASRLHRAGLPPLAVGTLSRRGGGKLGGHRSHQSGRDLDLGFYMLDAQGRPLTSPRFVNFNAGGEGRLYGQPVRFDVKRNWLLVQALLTEPQLNVKYIFVARTLKLQLLAYALGREEPVELIRRASEILREPRGDPHGHHFHLRIACSSDDSAAGCRDL